MLYGCDSNSDSFPCGANFYIGELNAAKAFNTAAAQQASPNNTFSYYFGAGPGNANAYTPSQAYAYGASQADDAGALWAANSYALRTTIFFDVEGGPGSFGWLYNQNYTGSDGHQYNGVGLNQKVWEGFYNELVNARALNPGLYTRSTEWGNIMGRAYSLNGHTPVWSFENVNSVACNACPTSLNVSTIGGETPTIWQYNQTPGCASDLNAATSLPS